MHKIIIDIVKSLEKTRFSTSQSHEDALKSLLIKAFEEKGQKHGMKGFMENLKKYSKGFWEGLFAYYDNSEIPKTNNDLERSFHLAKQDYRRIAGNDDWGRYIQYHGEKVMFTYNYTNKQDDMIKRFTEIGKLPYRLISKEYLNKNSDHTLRYRYNRNSALYLSKLEDMCNEL